MLTPCGQAVFLITILLVIAQLVTPFSVARAVTRSRAEIPLFRAIYATPEGSPDASGSQPATDEDDDDMVTNIEQMVKGAMEQEADGGEEQELEKKLSDDKLADKIFGDSDEVEKDLLSQISAGMSTFAEKEGVEAVDTSEFGIDASELEALRDKAKQSMRVLIADAPATTAVGLEKILTSALSSSTEGGGGKEIEGDAGEFAESEENNFASEIEAVEEEGDLQATFTALLKATLDTQLKDEQNADASDDLMASTVDAVQTQNLEALDMRSILGDALTSLTEVMGIDMSSELKESQQAKEDLSKIMTNGMVELSRNLQQLDEQNSVLYQRLETLKSEVRSEQQRFEEVKQLELDDLLQMQDKLRFNFTGSQEYLRTSNERLTAIMREITTDADLVTTFAMFPSKPLDKKVAFVVGLSLMFKVPFDTSQLFAIRSSDPSELLSLVTQSLVGLACFNHFGLFSAISNTLKKKKKQK